LRDAHPLDEEAQTSLVAGRTPWPAGLRSLEEQKKKEELEEEPETQRQLQEQNCRQEPQELEEQQQQQQGAKKGDRSSPLLTVRPNRYHRRRKSPETRKRVCRFSAL
jgi:hypothetical protein